MIIKIKSKNNNLLSLLNKNPNTDEGLYLNPLRNGVIIGNVINKNEYHVVFQDSKHSYTNYEDNQIDYKSFCSPMVILNIVSELFDHILKEDCNDKYISWLDQTFGDVDTQRCEIFVENIQIDSNWYKDGQFLLSKYIEGIEIIDKHHTLFSLRIKAESVFEAINLLTLTAFFIELTNNREYMMDSNFIKKYVRIFTNIKNIPYFVYYLFIKRISYKTSIFSKIKEKLEQSYKDNFNVDVNFTAYDTHTDRINFVRNHLDFSNTILDYGCGEFRYFKSLNKTIEGKYIGYDKEDYSQLYDKLSDRYKDKDWEFTQSLESVSKIEPLSVIMSEVIEHSELTESKELIKYLIDNYNVQQLIITTPNKNFNKYYNVDIRHNDHKIELTEEEFVGYIKRLLLWEFAIPGNSKDEPMNQFGAEFYRFANFELRYFKIGDCVGKDCVTSGCIITKI